jgi:hypothetical protein
VEARFFCLERPFTLLRSACALQKNTGCSPTRRGKTAVGAYPPDPKAGEGQGAVDADREGGLRDGLVPTTMPTPAHVQLVIARRRAGLPEIKGLESKSTEWVNSEMGQKEGQRAHQDKAQGAGTGAS